MNNELTPDLKKWLDSEPKDLHAGAELLLRITKNRILYNNIMRNTKRYAEAIEYNIRKLYNDRLQEVTHAEVVEMMSQVSKIAKARGLDKGAAVNTRTEWQNGKRADHDELPAEIQQLYVDNADIMHRMRVAHTKLCLISPDNSTCPDNDRFPLAKDIIRLDDKYRDNYNIYDHYIKGTDPKDVVMAKDPRTESKNAAKLCNLLLGKYLKAPTDDLAARIKAAYAKINLPTEALRNKMAAAKLL